MGCYIDSIASYDVINAWPTEILFSGWEIGSDILTGKQASMLDVENNPIKDAYAIALAQDNPEGRSSWDLTAVFTAIKGAEPYFNTERGKINVERNGSNTWTTDENGNHVILVQKLPVEEMGAILENYITKQPKLK